MAEERDEPEARAVLLRLGTPLAKPVDVHAAFKRAGVTDRALQSMQLLTERRERMVAVMRDLGEHDATAPRALLAALREYLPYIGTVCTQLLAAQRTGARVPAFRWTSILAKQPPRRSREVKTYEYASFEEECATAFSLFGLAHLQAAEELLRPGARAAESKEAAALLGDDEAAGSSGDPHKDAVQLLREGAGVFLWLVQVMLPRLELPRGSPKDSAPEMWPEVLSCLYHLALGDVQEIAIAQATRRGSTSAGLLAKLHFGAADKYATAWSVPSKAMVSRIQAVNEDLKTYLHLKRDAHRALGYLQLALQEEKNEKWGRGVAILREAARHAKRLHLPAKSEAAANPSLRALAARCAEVKAEVEAELARMHKDNETVYYQQEPAKFDVPRGMLLQTAREQTFEPPPELDCYFFATDPNKKGSCVVS